MNRRYLVAVGVFASAAYLVFAGVAADHPIPPPLKERPPTTFECRWADGPITIDGTADEPAWKTAQAVDWFHLPWLGDQARLARTRTTAKLLWDREYLYFFAEMEDTDLFADVTEHDGDTWTNDVFELFFRPAKDKPGYYEFQVNAAGTKFDCFFPKRGAADFATLKKTGTFHLDAKVKLRGTLNKRDDADQGWSVEGRLPWTDFLRTGGRPEPGETWTANLCRYDFHKDWKEPELSCVAPVKARSFHEIENYAAITFVGSKDIPAGLKPRLAEPSTVVGFPDPPPPYIAKRVLPNYRPGFPVMVKNIPGTDQMFVITQPSPYAKTALFRFTDDQATADAAKVMDTPDGGVAYDLTFHPKFADNGYVYVGWNVKDAAANKHFSRITRYTMERKPPYALDPASAKTVIEWESNGHNGAAVCFGTDGLMYVTSGDGTSDSDTNLMGQRTDVLLAKVLRIDVDKPGEREGVSPPRPYSVPKDNPFVGNKDFAPETWAYGLRNPWRITCDPKTGHIWVGNNGQDLWEQAYFVRKGENYGWSVMEGGQPFYPTRTAGPTPFTKPTVEHHHSEARSLTGGVVYHGEKLPGLKGAYIYGDYSTGHIWAVRHDGTKVTWHEKIAITPMKITAFATDSKGELLICDHAGPGDGGFYTLEPNPKKTADDFPKTLSASGLFERVKTHTLKPGAIPYSVNAPFWSDGLHKERFLVLPPGAEKIGFTRSNGWNFPDRTVIVKSFAVEEKEGDPASRRWVETRFLTKQTGEWYGYTYLWNDAGTDATLLDAKGTDREFTIRTATGDVRKQTWHYPSRAECMVCHTRAANFVLGLCEIQMNKTHAYPDGTAANQLQVLERLGVLNIDWAAEVRDRVKDAADKQQPGQREPKPGTLLHQPPAKLEALADPADKTADLTKRAKAWLHTNCSACHVEAGGGNARMELGFATAVDKMRLVGEKPLHQAFDLPDAKLLAPGSPERSVLLHRIGLRGPGQMPPLSTNRVDEAGLELMREWCRSLGK